MRRLEIAAGCRLLTVAAAALMLAGEALATQVYTWTDEDGVVHYSDSPRGSGEMTTIEAPEAYRPGTSGVYEPEAAEAPAADEVPRSAAEARRESMRQRGAEKREKRAETERLCDLHRQRMEKMEPARRVFYRNEAGEEVRMDDEQRIALVEEDKAFLAENCR